MAERSAMISRASGARPTGVLAIGVSTGGPTALTSVLSELPASFALPVVITQHMPPGFTRLLADRLSMRCPIPVREAQGGELLRPGEAWIAPGDKHLVVAHGPDGLIVELNQDPPENCCRPSVDVLFRSVAAACGENAIAVVLTGMGHDGLNGCRWIKEKRGRVIAQDQETSVVWGMPGSVARAGIADQVLPLQLIASELLRMTDRGVGARIAREVGAKP
jgi:two-component system chemotaxis response regulator CheB